MHKMYRMYVFVIIVMSNWIQPSHSTWWLLGMPTTYRKSANIEPEALPEYCDSLTDILNAKQRAICNSAPRLMHTIGRGAKLAVHECQHQFRTYRWNCTAKDSIDERVFGRILDTPSREKAYIYAITSAGAAYSITKSCARGDLPGCRCDERILDKDTRGKWQWGGCSDDIRAGSSLAKNFTDAIEDRTSADGLMNIHNNEAGRRALRSGVELLCKCHGVSGSCAIRVCWRRLKEFRKIGDTLGRRFDGATLIQAVRRKNNTALRPAKRDVKRPARRDLVFLHESPDYCSRNESSGVLGTTGRACNATSYGLDSCTLLCCGRGYQTIVATVEEKCNCKFVWCCKVECEMCLVKKEQHFCN